MPLVKLRRLTVFILFLGQPISDTFPPHIPWNETPPSSTRPPTSQVLERLMRLVVRRSGEAKAAGQGGTGAPLAAGGTGMG